jgi:hypothetical protein
MPHVSGQDAVNVSALYRLGQMCSHWTVDRLMLHMIILQYPVGFQKIRLDLKYFVVNIFFELIM